MPPGFEPALQICPFFDVQVSTQASTESHKSHVLDEQGFVVELRLVEPSSVGGLMPGEAARDGRAEDARARVVRA
jgi:hypothetical protein